MLTAAKEDKTSAPKIKLQCKKTAMPPNRKNTLQDQLKDKGNQMATAAKQG